MTEPCKHLLGYLFVSIAQEVLGGPAGDPAPENERAAALARIGLDELGFGEEEDSVVVTTKERDAINKRISELTNRPNKG
jgi:hypothetical protein